MAKPISSFEKEKEIVIKNTKPNRDTFQNWRRNRAFLRKMKQIYDILISLTKDT